MKTAELTGALLDYWVAKAIGLATDYMVNGRLCARVPAFIDCPSEDRDFGDIFSPSTRWDHGGPVIERDGIELHCIDRNGRRLGEWIARHPVKPLPLWFAAKPLIAAMRAKVASVYGDEVPDLTNPS